MNFKEFFADKLEDSLLESIFGGTEPIIEDDVVLSTGFDLDAQNEDIHIEDMD